MNRHISIGEFIFLSPADLSGSSAPVFLFFGKQPCNDHEVICKHGGSHEEFKPLATLGQTTLHAAPSEKNGNSALNTGAEALAIFEARAFLVRRLFRCLIAAALRNAYDLDTRPCALFDILFAKKTSIGAVDLGYIPKGFPVAFQRRFDLGVIRGISIEHLVLSDQPAGAFCDVDFMAEFNRLQNFASFDKVGMRFKYGKDLLLIRHLLLVKHPSPRLIHNTIPETAVVIDLFSNSLDCDFGHQIRAMDSFSLFKNLSRVFDNLIRSADELGMVVEFVLFSRESWNENLPALVSKIFSATILSSKTHESCFCEKP